jgi:hypothetical protein
MGMIVISLNGHQPDPSFGKTIQATTKTFADRSYNPLSDWLNQSLHQETALILALIPGCLVQLPFTEKSTCEKHPSTSPE